MYEKYIPKMLVASFLKSVLLMPQTVIWTFFSTSIPAISDLVVFGFNPNRSVKNLNFSER